jgi:23S rRNA pseudouridine1911/1915/1917 synthase
MRLDVALIRKHPELSRRKARDVIEKGQVSVDGATVLEAGRLVTEAARLAWNPNLKARRRLRPPLPLLYEDDALLVVDKPAGLLSVPTTAGDEDEDTASSRLLAFVQRLRPKRPYVGLVHRLDRDTSGALAFALDPATRGALRALFKAHHIERRYEALVLGRPEADAGTVDAALADEYVGRRRVARPGEPSHAALTRWRVLERLPGAARLEVELETGRQHQIRVHLAHVGLPVLGDAVYGAGSAQRLHLRVPRQLLHARVLAFAHPSDGRPVRVEAPLPDDFAGVLAALRRRRR